MKALEESIANIYAKHLDKVYGFFYYKTYDTAVSEDLTSSTFVVFVEKMRAHQSIQDPEGFLYGIMKKVWLRHLQQKYKVMEHFIEDMDDFAAYVEEEVDEEQSKADHERVAAFIAKLPEAQRKIIELRLIEQKSLKEICEITGKNMNYVKTTQKRGLKSLRDLVSQSHMEGA